MEATEDIKPNVQVLSEPEKNTERDFESITEPTKRNERAHDKDYDRIARSCEDSDVNRIFSISQIMIKAMANENFRNIEEVSFYIVLLFLRYSPIINIALDDKNRLIVVSVTSSTKSSIQYGVSYIKIIYESL